MKRQAVSIYKCHGHIEEWLNSTQAITTTCTTNILELRVICELQIILSFLIDL